MDRPIVYAAAIPQDTDILSANRNAMVGLGMLALDILGSSTLAAGFACTANSPASLSVLMAPGRLYSLQNIDSTPYGSLAADITHQILKQGISLDTTQLNLTATATSGFSTNWLIQAAYQDVDTDLQLLQYYNSQNIDQPLSGPGNSGTSQATRRKGAVILTAKAGIPATTGTQATPAPDSGNVGLWVVTIANGQATVTSANISMYFAAPFVSGSFPVTLTGCTTAPSATVNFYRSGPLVTLIIPSITGISNANTCGMSGLPTPLQPSSLLQFAALGGGLLDNGTQVTTQAIQVSPGSNLLAFVKNSSTTTFTIPGTKGISGGGPITYLVA